LNKKRISIWGATGSIGQQTLEVIDRHRDQFELVTLTTHQNVQCVLSQIKKYRPENVIITGEIDKNRYNSEFQNLGVRVFWGKETLIELASRGEEEMVVNGLVGGVGLEATLSAIQAGTSIALANKEVLVMAGKMVMEAVKKYSVQLIPVDSEHSAIFQCLQGEESRHIRRIILTASGGPFLHREKVSLKDVTVEEALAHPNWSMGKKITIDSATLVNKGLEIIEARWLFGVPKEKIEVVIHPQSVVHSMVEFEDGSIKAQMGKPDMRCPIAYALTYPERWSGNYGSFDFTEKTVLEFYPPGADQFPCLQLAYKSLEIGGTATVVLNAADEMAVALFLSGKIRYLQIQQLIESALSEHQVVEAPTLKEIFAADQWARSFVVDRSSQTYS
jgi:1-deoxy-D-xylulose-5-phosphate reductoisomerase